MGSTGRTRRIVVATRNRGKLRELASLLHADLPADGPTFELLTLDDVGLHDLRVVEDGATFRENALKKAEAVARAAQMPALADDSGLEVDALGGRPGVHSARFAGEHATDAENNAALLDALRAQAQGGAWPAFSARFRCVLAFVDPGHGASPIVAEGTCEGSIAPAPRGEGGFGYDPLFVLSGDHRTLAELSPAEKNAVSHRARAVAALRSQLERAGLWP